MQSAGSGDQPERLKHDRQKHGGRGNPEWMGEDSDAVTGDAAGVSAGARRAQQFEAERQRMKEEWKKQAQLKGAAAQPVCLGIHTYFQGVAMRDT